MKAAHGKVIVRELKGEETLPSGIVISGNSKLRKAVVVGGGYEDEYKDGDLVMYDARAETWEFRENGEMLTVLSDYDILVVGDAPVDTQFEREEDEDVVER